tara:strand:- start:32 stop:151 length:120 start_codon:yes stop_codon:yes gene_type:complete
VAAVVDGRCGSGRASGVAMALQVELLVVRKAAMSVAVEN